MAPRQVNTTKHEEETQKLAFAIMEVQSQLKAEKESHAETASKLGNAKDTVAARNMSIAQTKMRILKLEDQVKELNGQLRNANSVRSYLQVYHSRAVFAALQRHTGEGDLPAPTFPPVPFPVFSPHGRIRSFGNALRAPPVMAQAFLTRWLLMFVRQAELGRVQEAKAKAAAAVRQLTELADHQKAELQCAHILLNTPDKDKQMEKFKV